MKIIAFAAILAATSCCPTQRVQRDFWLGSTETGYENVTIYERGSMAAGLFKPSSVFSWQDARVEEWISMRAKEYGGEERLRRLAHGLYWIFVDDWRVNVSESGDQTVYQSAYTDAKSFIIVCIYVRAGPQSDEPDAHPWMKRLNAADGKWYYATISKGRELSSISSQLDRCIGIDGN